VAGDVVDDLPPSGRVTHVHGVVEVETLGDRSQVVGVVVHVVTVAGLRGAAMTPPVVGSHSIATIQEKQHLGVPIICRKWPAVTEHDREIS
jgi:hypothetical protein